MLDGHNGEPRYSTWPAAPTPTAGRLHQFHGPEGDSGRWGGSRRSSGGEKTSRALGWFLAVLVLAMGFMAVTAAQEGKSAPGPAGQPSSGPAEALTLNLIMQRIGVVAVILVVAYAAYRVISASLSRAMEVASRRSVGLVGTLAQRQQRAVTVLSLLHNVARWVIALLALVWILGAMGVNLLPVLTGVGFLGAAIAFGSQTLVRDVVSGFFVLLEGQYAVGDYVEVSGKFGRVEAVGLRTTVLRDVRDQVHHIPNGAIATTTVYTDGRVRQLLRVPIANAEQAQRAAALIQQMGEAARKELPGQLLGVGQAQPVAGADGLTQVVLPFAVFPTQDWIATTELPNRARIVLARHGVALPEGLAPHVVDDLSAMLTPDSEPVAAQGAEPQAASNT